ncbi:MAG: response regulator receiver [Syntrophaceae bacterium]|nr:MAG: response regulator receiver [Syntrophaceae bacterium]
MSGEGTVTGSVTARDESQGRPFGFMAPKGETAMVCEQDAAARDKIVSALKSMGYAVVEATSCGEAVKFMRFQIFSVIVVHENFDTVTGGINSVLLNLEGLSMSIRRQTFVVLLSATLPTMDNLEAYHKSVNLIINNREIGELEKLLRQAMAEHEDFYRVFKEKIRK